MRRPQKTIKKPTEFTRNSMKPADIHQNLTKTNCADKW